MNFIHIGDLSKNLYQIKICGLNFSTKILNPEPSSGKRRRQTFFQKVIESPEARERATFTRFKEKALLLGGLFEDEGGTWIFNHTNHSSIEWNKVEDINPELSNRYSHTCLYEEKKDAFIVFGGCNGDEILNDLWILNLAQDKEEKYIFKYEKIELDNSPSSRYDHGACIVGQKMYLFGGTSESTTYGDLWIFNIEHKKWRQIETNSSFPSPRSSHLFVSIDKIVILFGGIDRFKMNYPLDAYKFDTSTLKWIEEKFSVDEHRKICSPSKPRFNFSYCTYNKVIFIHGGLTFTKKLFFNNLKIINQVSLIETNLTESKEMKFKEWIVRRVLGSGTFGEVFKVSNMESPNEFFALKVLKSSKEKESSNSDIIIEDEKLSNDLREVLLQEKMNHKNILPILDAFITKNTVTKENQVCILMPLMKFTFKDIIIKKRKEFQELTNLLKTHAAREKFEGSLMEILIGILEGLNHIHSNSILHLDLKPENVLFDETNDIPKIADFGLSKRIGVKDSFRARGTPGYMDDLAYKGEFSTSTDVYAFGVIMYNFLVFKSQNLLEKITFKFDTIIQNFIHGEKYAKIIQQCLEKNLEKRISISKMLTQLNNLRNLLIGSKIKHHIKGSPSMPMLKRIPSTPREETIKSDIKRFSGTKTIEAIFNSMNLDQYKEVFHKDGLDIKSSFLFLPEEKIIKNVKNVFHRNRILLMLSELENEQISQHKEFKDFLEKYDLDEFYEKLLSLGYDDLYFLAKLSEKEIELLEIPNLALYLKDVELFEEDFKFYDIGQWLKYIGLKQYDNLFVGALNMLDLFQLSENDIDELLKSLPEGHLLKFKKKLIEQKQIWLKK